jgi:hypothetical protein
MQQCGDLGDLATFSWVAPPSAVGGNFGFGSKLGTDRGHASSKARRKKVQVVGSPVTGDLNCDGL